MYSHVAVDCSGLKSPPEADEEDGDASKRRKVSRETIGKNLFVEPIDAESELAGGVGASWHVPAVNEFDASAPHSSAMHSFCIGTANELAPQQSLIHPKSIQIAMKNTMQLINEK